MTEKQHAKLSASSMGRWKLGSCSAAPRLCAGLPNTDSAAASEGSFAHDWAEKFCRYHLLGEDVPSITTNFAKLEDEMKAAIWLYFETLQGYYKPSRGDKLWLEVSLDKLKDIHPDGGGTADAIIWQPTTQLLVVVDFKYGKGHHVDVKGNDQLQVYALGALLQMELPAIDILIVVVQPRCPSKGGKVRDWRMEPLEILDFEDFYYRSAVATEDPTAQPVIGRYCFFCPARQQNACPAHREAKMEKALGEFQALPDEDDDDPFEDDDPFN